MSIQVFGDNKEIESKLVTFSDGAINVWIDPVGLREVSSYLCLTIKPDTPVTQYEPIIDMSEDIISEFLTDSVSVELNLPYFPNARADRVFEKGMSCPLDWVLATISTASVFDIVTAKDLHNNSTVQGKLDPVTLIEIPQLRCFKETANKDVTLQKILKSNDLVVCSPDVGAKEKAKSVADNLRVACIELNKDRDHTTGWIKSVEIVNKVDVDGLDVLIVDDICDGGMTFIKSAEALRNAGARSVSLYVTHGIFSKGLDIFNGLIDNMFCNQIVMDYVTQENINEFNGGK